MENIQPGLKKEGRTSKNEEIKSLSGYRKREKVILCHENPVHSFSGWLRVSNKKKKIRQKSTKTEESKEVVTDHFSRLISSESEFGSQQSKGMNLKRWRQLLEIIFKECGSKNRIIQLLNSVFLSWKKLCCDKGRKKDPMKRGISKILGKEGNSTKRKFS